MSIKHKALTATILLSSLSGRVDAQISQNDSIPQQNPKEITNKANEFVSFFENLYSNALYLKYRTDAGININALTPPDMVKKIEKEALESAQKLYEMKKSKVPKTDIMQKHQEQLSGVIISEDGRNFSYPYTKDGKRRIASAELNGSATNFLLLEKEQKEFNNFFGVQKDIMNKKFER